MMPYLTYQTLQEYTNVSGSNDLGTVFFYANSIMPFISICVLFPLFMIVLLSTYFAQKRMTGRGDIFASLTASSLVTTLIAGILTLTTPPLVSTSTLIVCIGIFIISVIVLFATRD